MIEWSPSDIEAILKSRFIKSPLRGDFNIVKKMKTLADRINTLYGAFRDVAKPRKIDGCPCCIDEENIRILLLKPLRELTGGELAQYSSSAFLTVGTEADFLYFLPRIVEVACTEDGCYPDVEIIGQAIGETKPLNWSIERRKALLDVLHSAIQRDLDEEVWTADEWICAIARMGLDVKPFLEQIETSPSQLLSYYESNSQALMKDRLGNAFWERSDIGYNDVVYWFKSPKVLELIHAGYGLIKD